jgi:hypothetical protein
MQRTDNFFRRAIFASGANKVRPTDEAKSAVSHMKDERQSFNDYFISC